MASQICPSGYIPYFGWFYTQAFTHINVYSPLYICKVAAHKIVRKKIQKCSKDIDESLGFPGLLFAKRIKMSNEAIPHRYHVKGQYRLKEIILSLDRKESLAQVTKKNW
jgi:hypothetical protein